MIHLRTLRVPPSSEKRIASFLVPSEMIVTDAAALRQSIAPRVSEYASSPAERKEYLGVSLEGSPSPILPTTLFAGIASLRDGEVLCQHVGEQGMVIEGFTPFDDRDARADVRANAVVTQHHTLISSDLAQAILLAAEFARLVSKFKDLPIGTPETSIVRSLFDASGMRFTRLFLCEADTLLRAIGANPARDLVYPSVDRTIADINSLARMFRTVRTRVEADLQSDELDEAARHRFLAFLDAERAVVRG